MILLVDPDCLTVWLDEDSFYIPRFHFNTMKIFVHPSLQITVQVQKACVVAIKKIEANLIYIADREILIGNSFKEGFF